MTGVQTCALPILENMHLIGNEENYKWLMESKRQLKEGMLQMKELIEVSEDE